MEIELPVKSYKIKQTHEYNLLERLKKLWVLLFCSECPYEWKCCWKCEESAGYLRYKIESESYPEPYWDKDKGCKLSPHLRSVTCLTYLCEEKKATMDKDYLDGLAALIEVMRKIEFDIYLMDIK